jgi:hypothetical protein
MRARPPREIVEQAKQITGKRARVVVDHILKHGSITTEDLEKYGYKHPPRAVRDVIEQGLPLERFETKNRDGRRIAGYRFGKPADVRHDRVGGRRMLPKAFKAAVIESHESKCAICETQFDRRHLQVDHAIPYEVAGDVAPEKRAVAHYMPLCGSCNRAKSWSCEHCRNWAEFRNPDVCRTCYWASPHRYTHIALREIRRLDVVWQEREVCEFDGLSTAASRSEQTMPEYVKRVLRKHLGKPT